MYKMPCFLGAIVAVQTAFAIIVSENTTVGDADLSTYTGADTIVIDEGATLTFSGISSAYAIPRPVRTV